MPDTRTDQQDCAHPSCGCKVAAGNEYLQRLLQEGTRDGAPLQLHAPWMSRVTGPGLTRRKQPRLRRSVAAGGCRKVQVFADSSRDRQAQPNAQTVWKIEIHCRRDHGSCR